jgi:hypothetical protein
MHSFVRRQYKSVDSPGAGQGDIVNCSSESEKMGKPACSSLTSPPCNQPGIASGPERRFQAQRGGCPQHPRLRAERGVPAHAQADRLDLSPNIGTLTAATQSAPQGEQGHPLRDGPRGPMALSDRPLSSSRRL